MARVKAVCPRQKQRSRGNLGHLRCAELGEDEKESLLQLRNPGVWQGLSRPSSGAHRSRLALNCSLEKKHPSRPLPELAGPPADSPLPGLSPPVG